MIISDEISRQLRATSFLAALSVVYLHFCPSQEDGGLVNRIFICCIGRGISFHAVQFFFVVSGYFLVKNYRSTFEWWWGGVKRRMQSLLIPFLIWCLAWSLYIYFFREFNLFSLEGVLSTFGIGRFVLPKYTPMWYVRNLMVLVFVSPLIIFCAKAILRIWCGPLMLVLIYLGISIPVYPLKHVMVIPTFYFFIGVSLGIAEIDLSTMRARWSYWALGIMLLLKAVALVCFENVAWYGNLNASINDVAIPFTLVAIWTLIGEVMDYSWMRRLLLSAPAMRLYSISFFLYCFHMWFVFSLPRWPSCLNGCAWQPVIETVSVLVGALIVRSGLERICPRVYVLLSGGR